jgi:hypothetical protein
MSRRRTALLLAALVPVVLVIAAVVVARSGSTHRPPRLPVAAGGGGAPALATADAGATAALYPNGGIVYEAGPGLPALQGSGRAYRLPSSSVGEADVRRLATALGLSGDPVAQEGGGLVVQDGDRTLNVYPQSGGSWSFFRSSGKDGSVGSGTSSSGTVTAAPDGTVVEPPPPERPADLPSEDQAKAAALELVRSTGVDVNGADVHVDDAFTQWSVRVDPVIDGMPTSGLTSYVTVGSTSPGEHSAIDYASGYLARPARADVYPLTGTSDAIDRLNRGEGFGGGIRPLATDTATAATATAAPICERPKSSSDLAGGGGGASGNACSVPPAQPNPSDPVPLPSLVPEPPPSDQPVEPQHVTLTDARQVLLFTVSADGLEGWLVPGYAFSTDGASSGGGDGPVVLAVGGEFLQ